MGDDHVSKLPSLLHRVLDDLASETRNPLQATNKNAAENNKGDSQNSPNLSNVNRNEPKYLIYFRLPWRVEREAFVKALCDAVDIAWGVCKKYPFQKKDYDGFWDGFRPRHIFFDTRDQAAPTDDWSEAVFLGYLPQDDFTEDDRAIVLFLGKLLLSAFSVKEGEYLLGDGEILPFAASRAIGLVPDDSAYVMKLIRSGSSASIQ